MKRTILMAFLLSFLTSTAWGAGHWVDVTTARTSGVNATAKYFRWSPVVSDSTGTVTRLRVSIRQYGTPTEIRLGLYSQSGTKLADGTAIVTAAGYKEIPVTPTRVTLGSTYFIAAQAVSSSLHKFECGATSGGFEGPNNYSSGFPQNLPGGWSDYLLTAGMYVEAGPTADFSGTPVVGTSPLSVSFTDTSSGSITNWFWSFGDGSQDTFQNPIHDYLAAGSYTVGLTVTAPDGSDTMVKSGYIQVLEPIPPGNNEFRIQVDPAAHQKFGLFYPVTYKFRINTGQSGLTAQYRYFETTWNNLPVKTSADIFNGIDAVRFNYAQGFAYISVRFSRTSDNIYLRVVDGSGAPVSMVFDSIPRYYDDRKAAVTISLDDWDLEADASFRLASDQLNALGLYYSVGLRLLDPPWNSYQEKINASGDFLEIASHSIYHSCDAKTYLEHGYDTELVASRDMIRLNLTFPAHPFIPLFIEPCGYSDATLQSWVTAGGYLIARSVDEPLAEYAPWDPVAGRYVRYGVTYDWWGNDTTNMRDSANAIFDKTLAAGGIYHFMDHPWLTGHWVTGSNVLQHMNHIKGRADVWYAPFGQMYLYRYLQEMRGGLTIGPYSTTPQPPTVGFSANPTSGYAPLSVQFADATTGDVTDWLWDFGDGGSSTLKNPSHTYTVPGSYNVTLTATGPVGSDTMTKQGYIQAQLLPPAPVANFSATPVSGTTPLSTHFTDASTGVINTWQWNFGDGGSSTLQSPEHTYTLPGAYNVTLTVTGPGGSNSLTRPAYIQVEQGSMTPHWVDVTTARTTGIDGTADYMAWSPLTADATATVTRLRISIQQFGVNTPVRLALYSLAGVKLTEAEVTVTAAGYVETAVPPVPVVQGSTYYLAAQAASPNLYKFACGASTGGFEGPNTYSTGLPQGLPNQRWGYKLLTGGMFIQ
jgi:PKD repeat protein